MSVQYHILYWLRFKPWDTGVVGKDLAEMVEGPEALPPGRALDLGCGTGTQAVYLAQHGWQVTGVDIVPRALAEASRKARVAGVHPTWVRGDITRLSDLGIGTDYDLVLDVGCFHGLRREQRSGTAQHITRVARPGATFLLGGFAPGKRGPLPSGIDGDEILQLFGDHWELRWQRKATDMPVRGPLKNADPSWYCLQKR